MVLFETLWNDQYWFVVIAMAAISLPLVVLVYMIGKAVSSNQMVAWAKDETYQLIGSFLIIGITIGTMVLLNSVVLDTLGVAGFQCTSAGCSYVYESFDQSGNIVTNNGICGVKDSDPCHIAIAKAGVNAQYDLVRYYSADQMSWKGFLDVLSGTKVELGVRVVIKNMLRLFRISPEFSAAKQLFRAADSLSLSVSPFAGVGFALDAYDNMLDILFAMVLLIKANWFFLEVVNRAVFPYFLVAGIGLRSLSITRKLGGLLIAIALVLFFIYPMVVILSEMLISPNPTQFKVDFGMVYGGSEEQRANSVSILDIYKNLYVDVGGNKLDLISYSIFKPIAPFVKEGNTIRPGGIIDVTAFFTVWITFQLVIVMYATIISIRELSPFFGGDIEIAGLTRLI